MKGNAANGVSQPEPFTPGLTKAEVCQHAFTLYRDKLKEHPLTLEDWILAEKDLLRLREVEPLSDAQLDR